MIVWLIGTNGFIEKDFMLCRCYLNINLSSNLDCMQKIVPQIQFTCIGLTVTTSGLNVRQFVLKNVIYLKVQNIHTYLLCKTMRRT